MGPGESNLEIIMTSTIVNRSEEKLLHGNPSRKFIYLLKRKTRKFGYA